MLVNFSKMHGLGNDFMVVDTISQHAYLRTEQIKRLADRHKGIGFDQLLLVEPPGRPDVDFRYRIFNADGSEVEQCGNGARCFARFVRYKHLTEKDEIIVETAKGVITLNLVEGERVRVDMGEPILEPAQIPFQADTRSSVYTLSLNDQESVQLGAVSMGNPHAVILVDDVKTAPVETWGPILESHPRFPEKVNVGFMQVVHSQFIQLRVFERGVGETQACGTGACAAVVSGRLRGLLDKQVEVRLPGGNLIITWEGEGHPVIMEGTATHVFDGVVRV